MIIFKNHETYRKQFIAIPLNEYEIQRAKAENWDNQQGAKGINEWAEEIHDNSKKHGWWDEPRSLAEIVALCHSELSEAVEEYRAGRPLVWTGEDGKPEGIAIEMADCLIRILDWFGHEGLNPDEIVRLKMDYNKGRPYKHGKKC